MKAFLLPYNSNSNACRVLAERLGVTRIKLKGSKFRPGYDKVIINWGNADPGINQPEWINSPEAIARASNKLEALWAMQSAGVPTVEFTDDRDIAYRWVNENHTVMARTKLRASQGDGIVVIDPVDDELDYDDIPRAKLYTKYFKGKREFRVHVINGQVFDVQEKRKRREDTANFKVRSHANGFVFCRENVDLPEPCADAAIRAVIALGLDFGAVDLRFNEHYGRAAVLEVNTAPGLEGTTLDKYTEVFTELLSNFVVQQS